VDFDYLKIAGICIILQILEIISFLKDILTPGYPIFHRARKDDHIVTLGGPPESPSQPPNSVCIMDDGDWFAIPNHVMDEYMPHLSPNAWRVLCVVIRQTWGWIADPDTHPKWRREWDKISCSQFQKKSGIKTNTTVLKALNECMEKGVLKRRTEGTEKGHSTYAYAVSRDWRPQEATDSSNEPVPGPVSEPIAGTDSGHTKERVTDKSKSDDGLTPEQAQGYDRLIKFGVWPSSAQRIARQRSLDQIQAWLDYATRKSGNLNNPPAVVAEGLRAGAPPPQESTGRRNSEDWRNDSEERRRRYAATPGVQS
jgi:hypothetical protein